MALVGNMIATAYAGNSAMVNFDIFVSVFGMLSLLYLLPTTIMGNFNLPILNIALDALNALFWFCGAVATAAYLGVHSCSNLVRSNDSPLHAISSQILTPSLTGLHNHQPHHQRLSGHAKTLPRSPGLDRLPILRLGRLRRFSRLLRPERRGQREHARRHPEERPRHEPGLGVLRLDMERPDRHEQIENANV